MVELNASLTISDSSRPVAANLLLKNLPSIEIQGCDQKRIAEEI
jgi:hypothetical protein